MLLLLLTCAVFSQKMVTRSGEIKFDATVSGALEEVIGTNKTVSGVFDKATGDIVVQAMVKSFKFKAPLMEEHFNENYMESDRYPKAVFKGKIEKFDLKDINEVEKEYQIKGKLNLRGKSKEIIVNALIKRVPEGIQVISDFPITVSDFNIKIPSKIASKISQTANTELTGIIHDEEGMYATLK